MRKITLIEVMIVLCIALIVAAVAYPAIFGQSSSGNITYGFNGVTESRCIEGYKFIVSRDGTRQIMDEFGKGVKCN